MAKRFTDTDIWKKQRWFRKLSPIHKLSFCYIKDMCNHSGVWKVECADLIDDLGLDEFNINEFIDTVNTEFDKVTGSKIQKERVILLTGNILWITGFIQYQYEGKDGKVNPEAAPVRTALHQIEGIHMTCVTLTQPLLDPCTLLNYALIRKHIRLTQPLREAWMRPKDKDIDKDNTNTLSKSLNSKNSEKNGKQFIGNKLQPEEIFAKRYERHRLEAEQGRNIDTSK